MAGTDVVMAGTDVVMAGTDVVMAGDDVVMAGDDVVMAGDDVVMAGDDVVMAGDDVVMAGAEVEFCSTPRVLVNSDREPNGYSACEGGSIIKTGPANCLGERMSDRDGECDTDANCPNNQQCFCGFDQFPGSRCIAAECQDSTECEIGGCGVSVFEDGCSRVESLACYTANDACRGGDECTETGLNACYATPDGWSCSDFNCAVGRPLTNGTSYQMAPLSSGDGWTNDDLTINCAYLSKEEIATVISHWENVTQLEHSSIASFSRFSLQMMAMGAPADILLAIQKATSDEIRHTQRAADILSGLIGSKVTLGAFPIKGLSIESSREALISNLIKEACFAETLGVAELTAALKWCDHPEISAHLSEVLEEETEHAHLAWKALKWLVESAPIQEQDQLNVLVQTTFAEVSQAFGLTYSESLISERSSSAMVQANINCFGVLTEHQTQQVRAEAFKSVIMPALKAAQWSQHIA